jgi:hypothetical protein
MSVETDVMVVVVETCNHFHAGDKGNVFFLLQKGGPEKTKKKICSTKRSALTIFTFWFFVFLAENGIEEENLVPFSFLFSTSL